MSDDFTSINDIIATWDKEAYTPQSSVRATTVVSHWDYDAAYDDPIVDTGRMSDSDIFVTREGIYMHTPRNRETVTINDLVFGTYPSSPEADVSSSEAENVQEEEKKTHRIVRDRPSHDEDIPIMPRLEPNISDISEHKIIQSIFSEISEKEKKPHRIVRDRSSHDEDIPIMPGLEQKISDISELPEHKKIQTIALNFSEASPSPLLDEGPEITAWVVFVMSIRETKMVWKYSLLTCWWRLFTALSLIDNQKIDAKAQRVLFIGSILDAAVFAGIFLFSYKQDMGQQKILLIALLNIVYAASIAITILYIYWLSHKDDNWKKDWRKVVGGLRLTLVFFELLFSLAILKIQSPNFEMQEPRLIHVFKKEMKNPIEALIESKFATKREIQRAVWELQQISENYDINQLVAKILEIRNRS